MPKFQYIFAGQAAVNHCVDTRLYSTLHALVNGMFPSMSSSDWVKFATLLCVCVCVLITTLFYSEVAVIEELYWKAVSKKVNSAFAAALILFPFSCTWEFVLSPLVAEGNEVQ